MTAGSRDCQGTAIRIPVGNCSPFTIVILQKRRPEFLLTTASGKNTSQSCKASTVALGPSGNPRALQQRYLLGPACGMGVQESSARKQPRGPSSHGVRDIGKERRAAMKPPYPRGQEAQCRGSPLGQGLNSFFSCVAWAELFCLSGPFRGVWVCVPAKITNVPLGLAVLIYTLQRDCLGWGLLCLLSPGGPLPPAF